MRATNGQQLEVFLLLFCFKVSGIHLELRGFGFQTLLVVSLLL